MVKKAHSLVEEAQARIRNLTPAQVQELSRREDVEIIDVRDIRELWQGGKISGAIHSPRGMLEFWIDPHSPYHRKIFAQPKEFIFYCAMGWRSALAAKLAQDMGLTAAHLAGGYKAWQEFGGATEEVPQKTYMRNSSKTKS